MPKKSVTKAPTVTAAEVQVGSNAGASTLNIAVSEPVPRAQRERKARTVYSPTTPVRNRAGANKKAAGAAAPSPPPIAAQSGNSMAVAKKSPGRSVKPPKARSTKTVVQKQQVDESVSEDAESATQEAGAPEYKKLEGRIRGQVKRLRYHLAFMEAYAAEGWRRASREKLKPSKELESAESKILQDKRAVLNTLAELQRTNASDTQYPQLAASAVADELQFALQPEDIYCSRCGSTDADEDNDILICDSDGCQRAYHQQCQRPWLKTQDIPVGDEHWYCEVCLAVFNSLKLINSAFGTTYDTVGELFPELDQEEQHGVNGGDEEEDEDEDEDFVNDAEDNANSGDESEDSDLAEDEESALGQHGEHGTDELQVDADESEISDQELTYLRKTDVIDPNSRSMRSNSKLKQTTPMAPHTNALLGQRAAKIVDLATGAVVFGVVVDELEDREQWQVVYYNDTMELLARDQVLAVIACAQAHEHNNPTGDMDDAVASDPKLILHGKRKRTQVNYRELNDAMFAGKADSDEEAEDGGATGAAEDARGALGGEVESDEEDYVPEAKTKPRKAGNDGEPTADQTGDDGTDSTSKRSRRERKSVDYHALNEGLLSY